MQIEEVGAAEELGGMSPELKITSHQRQGKVQSLDTTVPSLSSLIRTLWTKRATNDGSKSYEDNTLLKAAGGGDVQTMRTLLESGKPQVLEHEEIGKALLTAASKGFESIVELLINQGIDPNAQLYHGGNALCTASSKGHMNIVRRLLDNGADANIRGPGRTTPPLCAFANGHQNIIALLLQRGADVNATDNLGDHLIISTIFAPSHQMLRLLLEAGADPNAKRKSGCPAIFLAACRLDAGAIDLLVEYGGDINESGSVCSAVPKADAVKMLLEKGANPNVLGRDMWGYSTTALEKANSYRDNEEVVKILLKFGAKKRRYGLFAP